MHYTHFKTFISLNGFSDRSEAFKDGIEVAFDQIESNLARLSFKDLAEMLKDRYERSLMNLENAQDEDSRDFQLGYQAVCKHYLRNCLKIK